MANRPQKLTYNALTTAGTTWATFPTGVSQCHAVFSNVTTSTKSVATLQGGIGGATGVIPLSIATTLTTAAFHFGSTASAVFDRVRIEITSKTTNAGTISAYVIGR